MAFKASYDAENDVLYILFSKEAAERSQALDDMRIVDYDAAGKAVGVEFICASEGLNLDDVPFGDKLESHLTRAGLHFPIFA
jgi:uncharacterized protein YuzE